MMHSEFNASEEKPVHFLQVWIVPDKKGVEPRYEDRHFPMEKRRNWLCLIASKDEAEGSWRGVKSASGMDSVAAVLGER